MLHLSQNKEMKFTNPKFHLSLYKDFFSLIKNLKFERRRLLKKEIIKSILSLLILNLAIKIVTVIIANEFIGISTKVIERGTESFSKPVFAIILVLISPLIEEIAFRLSLKFKPLYFSSSVTILSYYLVNKIIYNISNFDYQTDFLTRITISFVLGLIAYIISHKNKTHFELFWNKHFGLIFYSLALVFGFVHILNYVLSLKVALLSPILVLPQLSSALIYSFIRIKYGFIYSLATHIINNSLVLVSVFN